MTSKISRNYMLYSSVREIWENLIETYSMKKDSIACYDIESKIFNSRQRTLSLTKYYGLKMCKVNSIGYTELVETGRIFKFLHGLNSKYDPIRVQILDKEKLPSLSKSWRILDVLQMTKTYQGYLLQALWKGENS
ncbi:hypothetical protein CR513_41764, partial [Mucuna pruriens]